MQEKLRMGIGFLKVDWAPEEETDKIKSKKKGPGANGPQWKLEREAMNKARSQRESEDGRMKEAREPERKSRPRGDGVLKRDQKRHDI